jgi:hypothetical protein
VNFFDVATPLVSLGVPTLIAVKHYQADARAAAATKRKAAEAKDKGVGLRDPTDLTPGQAAFRVHVVVPSGEERVSIGTSIENPNELSGEPTLTTNTFEVETAPGKRLVINGGERLKVNALAGAHRKLVDSITNEAGRVEQRFSFEIGEATTFVLSCTVSDAQSEAPFRQGATHVSPVGEHFEINPKVTVPEHTGMGCLVYPLLVFGAALPNVSTDALWSALTWVAWALLMALGTLLWWVAKAE